MEKSEIKLQLQTLVRNFIGRPNHELKEGQQIDDYIQSPVQLTFSAAIAFKFKKVDATDLANSIGDMETFKELINYIYEAYEI